MSLFMAGEDSPAFHDFLGLGQREDTNKREPNAFEIAHISKKDKEYDEAQGEASTKLASANRGQLEVSSRTVDIAGSLPSTFPASLERDSGNFSLRKVNLHPQGNKGAFYNPQNNGTAGKKRDSSDSRDSLQDMNQVNADALASWSMKVSRLEGEDARKTRQIPSNDDLHLTMQPPRPTSKGPAIPHSMILKADLSPSNSKKWNRSGQGSLNTGLLRQTQSSYAGVHTEQIPGSSSREITILTSQIPLPPADEGSWTGLKGSNMASILNNGSATPPARVPVCGAQNQEKSKIWSHSGGTHYQTMGTTSRQLTVFYGGQAHVFDDVSPEKAEAIMSLAGSSGRSWSTTYSCTPRGSLASSGNEVAPSISEREGERTISRDSAINGFSTLALSSELHTPRPTSRKTGLGGNVMGHTNLPEGNLINLSQPITNIHSITERRDNVVMHSLSNVDDTQKEV